MYAAPLLLDAEAVDESSADELLLRDAHSDAPAQPLQPLRTLSKPWLAGMADAGKGKQAKLASFFGGGAKRTAAAADDDSEAQPNPPGASIRVHSTRQLRRGRRGAVGSELCLGSPFPPPLCPCQGPLLLRCHLPELSLSTR